MFRYLPVRKIQARQVLDSRGNPTVEVEKNADITTIEEKLR